jgi:hypothetical protein
MKQIRDIQIFSVEAGIFMKILPPSQLVAKTDIMLFANPQLTNVVPQAAFHHVKPTIQ